MTYQPITDLSEKDAALHPMVAEDVRRSWSAYRNAVGDDIVVVLLDRLRRRWAIETGVIERVYELDRGTTQTLIEHGLEAALIPHGSSSMPGERLEQVLLDQDAAFRMCMDIVASDRPITTSFIRELHQLLCRHQSTAVAREALTGQLVDVPLLTGQWKRHPNNPTRPDGEVHEYAPPLETPAEMERLVEMHQAHAAKSIHPVVEAAWLHHRFTQVHPFQDGNGRVARALATVVLLRAKQLPLHVDRRMNVTYIRALEDADRGQFGSLVQLFDSCQLELLREIDGDLVDIIGVDDALEIAERVGAQRRSDSGLSSDGSMELARTKIDEIYSRLAQARIAAEGRFDSSSVHGLWFDVPPPALDVPARRGRIPTDDLSDFGIAGSPSMRYEASTALTANAGARRASLDISIHDRVGSRTVQVAVARLDRSDEESGNWPAVWIDAIATEADLDAWIDRVQSRWVLEVARIV